ncbi:ectoine/hydroxyectoine ABC transporter permease subunit EhuD [Thalassobacillus pellis]|uniref:ectoine/hydroxyectoine ABC transporter permease subunit EhuD n=1 Tax=Thalassobacillus pellis TaxID=748008 RepID=UPI00195F2C41|nr:ectoine/hydroxyectoine ABC transporter permease subunit EhuD [Thalassobacillus pellis]MBM7551846.1 polar amino acid transport system permease protein [Thalassobacillus pellis]
MRWDWSTVIEVFPLIFDAMWTTLGLTIACFSTAMIVGAIWTALKRIKFKPFNWFISFVLEFIRSTPPLVQLYFLFFAWPMIPYIGVTLDPFTVAVMGLGVHFSTYISEIYRSGIEGVPKGQLEAATALNFSTRQKWTKIILPQAIPPIIPMLGNYLIIMFKEIPLTIVVGVAGMLTVAEVYGVNNFEYLEPYTIVAFFFLAMSYPSSLLIQWLEKKMNRRFVNKPDKKGKGVTAT